MSIPNPSTLRLAEHALLIEWDDGTRSTLSAALLRASCRCTHCRRAAPERGAAIALKDIRPFGNNALQFVFSDGHERGVFPFVYLAELAGMLAPVEG